MMIVMDVLCYLITETNEEAKKTQKQQIVKLAESLLQRYGGLYTTCCFKKAEFERDKMILKYKAPQLRIEFQIKMSLLNSDIHCLITKPSEEAKQKIRNDLQDLAKEIAKQDKGYGILKDINTLLKRVEENLSDVEELKGLASSLEGIRQSKETWGKIGGVCTLVGVTVTGFAPPVGAAIAGGATILSAAVAGIMRNVYYNREMEIENEQTHLERKVLDFTIDKSESCY
jgi:hypothetical protein